MLASPVGPTHRQGVVRVVPETDGIVAVCLEGDFDLLNAPAFGDEIDRALEGNNDVILDLSQATFIDSSVINILVRASKAVHGRQQSVVLQLGTAAIVERALGIASIEQLLQRAHDRQEAVRIIHQQAETA